MLSSRRWPPSIPSPSSAPRPRSTACPRNSSTRASKSLEVVYYPTGTKLVTVGEKPLEHLYVIRKGAVRLERGRPDHPGARGGGDLRLHVAHHRQGHARRRRRGGPARLPDPGRGVPPAARRRRASPVTSPPGSPPGSSPAWSSRRWPPSASTWPRRSRRWSRRPAVWVDADATVGDAARAHDRGAGLVGAGPRASRPASSPTGTSASRVLAQGLGPGTPLERVLSRPLKRVEGAMPVHEAWTVLLEANVHHLPVVRDGRSSASSPTPTCSSTPPRGRSRCCASWRSCRGRESLPGYARKVTEMVASLLAGGLRPVVIAGFVAQLNDALDAADPPLGRAGPGRAAGALRLARARLGGAPGADAAHRPGQRARLRRRGSRLARVLHGARRPGQHRPHGGRLPEMPGRLHGPELLRDAHRVARHASPAWVGDPTARASSRRPSSSTSGGWPERSRSSRSRRCSTASPSGRPSCAAWCARRSSSGRRPCSCCGCAAAAPSSTSRGRGSRPVVFLARCYALAVGSHARNTLERL